MPKLKASPLPLSIISHATTQHMTDLSALRTRIDSIDDQMLKLICERANIAVEVAHVKVPGSPLYRPEREAMILRRIQAANPGPLSNDSVARIFREVISNCMALEQHW